VEYELLGPLRVLDGDGAEVPLPAPKVRSVLAVLLVNRGQHVSVDRIVDALWGDQPPRSAANLVQGYVRDLRRRLGALAVVTVTGGYRLDVPRGSVDADRFEDLARAGRYREALATWHGPALAEWSEQPWARAIAVRLEEERLAVLEFRLTQDLDAGLASAVIAELRALVEEHPLRERLRVLLVKALYANGRQVEALEAYAQARSYLVDEVGIEPGPELRAVLAAVLAQDPTLVPAPHRPAATPPLPVNPLIGREQERATLRRSLMAARLVTLAGPGGVGKTRLAVEVAAATHSPSGTVWFVDLAPVSHHSDVPTAVARALQLADSAGHEIDHLCDYLSRHQGLLVLDTCEHVVEGVAELATALLARCPDLQILTTTREPLTAPGEHVIRLAGSMTLRAWSCSWHAPERWTPLLTSTTTRPATLSASWMGFRLHSSWQLRGPPPCRWRSLPEAWTIRSSCSRVRYERVTQGTGPCGLSSRGAMTSSIGVTERLWRHFPCSWGPSTATRRAPWSGSIRREQ
jgi:DNA-binding SARP family transcriptional activator